MMLETKLDTSDQEVQARNLRPAYQPESRYHGDRWAVIVGISNYAHPELHLDYADRDADELYKIITSPRGGDFKEDHIKKLTNKEATYMAVNQALRSFLKQPKLEDLVLIYFACHGAPDPGTNNVYLLTHDTDPNDIAGTAQPMQVIQEVLRTTLKAKYVVIFVDACHGAAVGNTIGGTRGGINDAAILNRYLLDMGQAREGIAMLTSSEANEVAYEGKQWGDGHGVFTHCLLEGLKGDADDGTGVVRLGNLIEYVRKRVMEETGNLQHPTWGNDAYDRKLPMAVIGDISVAEHFELGCNLYEMGRLLPDKGCFASAVHHFNQAINLNRELFNMEHARAVLQKGLALIAQEKYAEAIGCLTAMTGNDEMLSDVLFHLIIAYAKSGQQEVASEAISKFLTYYPDDARGTWLRQFRQSCMRALLIGIGVYQHIDTPLLEGVASDVQMVAELLSAKYDLHEENRKILLDENATRMNIIRSLHELAQISGGGDQIIIYYTGWAETKYHETYLLPVDYETDRPETAISAQELHDLVRSIYAGAKTVIIDCAPSSRLIDLAKRDGGYHLYLAAQFGQISQVKTFDDNKHGVFTYALVQALRDTPDASLADLRPDIERIIHKYVDPSLQTPVLLGDDSQPLLWRHYGKPYLTAYDLSFRRVFYDLTIDELRQQEERLTEHPLPALPCAIARGFIEKKKYNEAIKTLEWLKKQRALQGEEILTLGLAHLGAQGYAEAQDDLQSYIDTTPEHADRLNLSLKAIQELQTQSMYALLVGVSKYANQDIPSVKGAANDVEGMRRVLIDYLGIPAGNIEILTDAQATTSMIREAFSSLAQKARRDPALFYYAGNGSRTVDGQPTILGYDARLAPIPNDILLADLAQTASNEPTNLVSVIDAGWEPGLEVPWSVPWGSRFASCDPRPRPMTRALRRPQTRKEPTWTPTPQWLEQRARSSDLVAHLRLGWVTIYPPSIQATLPIKFDRSGEAIVEAEFSSPFNVNKKEIHGALTAALLRILLINGHKELTYITLREALEQELQWLQPFILCIRSDERIFSNVVQEEYVHKSIREIGEQATIRRAIDLLEKQIHRSKDNDSQGWLDLGIAYAALNQLNDSLDALIKAQNLGLNSAELYYWLGRMRYEASLELDEARGELDAAIGNLRDANKIERCNPASQYYFVRALIASIERKHMQELEEAWKAYVRLGAPLGHREEIEPVLKKLRTTGLDAASIAT